MHLGDAVRDQRVKRLYTVQKMSVRAIAQHEHLTRQGVYYILAKLGVPLESEVTGKRGVSRAQMVTYLQILAKTLGRTPRASDLLAGPRGYKAGNYYRVFGSLHVARREAGLPEPTRDA